MKLNSFVIGELSENSAISDLRINSLVIGDPSSLVQVIETATVVGAIVVIGTVDGASVVEIGVEGLTVVGGKVVGP